MTADAAAVRRRPKDRKQQILVQARDLFLGLGYPNVSMAMIADRVGITAGALYRHYSTTILTDETMTTRCCAVRPGARHPMRG
jgi:AcrR family transcriptional regulator